MANTRSDHILKVYDTHYNLKNSYMAFGENYVPGFLPQANINPMNGNKYLGLYKN